jgi:hypothetical protein
LLAQTYRSVKAWLLVVYTLRIVLADAAYKSNTAWRNALQGLGLGCADGVVSSVAAWASSTLPVAPVAWRGQGRPKVNCHGLLRLSGACGVTGETGGSL